MHVRYRHEVSPQHCLLFHISHYQGVVVLLIQSFWVGFHHYVCLHPRTSMLLTALLARITFFAGGGPLYSC